MGVLLEEAEKVGYRAQGIDISHDAVLYCRKKKLDVLEGTLASVGKKLKEHSFDVVTAFEIIEHERDPLGMMRWVLSLLKNGGIAVLTTPNHDSLWRKIMGRRWVGYHHPEHVTFWDTGSLTFLMKRAGFSNIVVRRDSPRPFPLSFVFTRGADYFPWTAWIFKPIGRFLDRFSIKNPINPWDDLIVIAKK
jgi:SAM-dependent methyltransferase